MFGYMAAFKPELRIKEYHTYRAYYCGLCRSIKAYGQGARLLLNYDCTFLYMLHSALMEDAVRVDQGGCMAHPWRRSAYLLQDAAPYAAAVNVLLGAANLQDKRADGQQLLAGAALTALKGAQKKAAAAFPQAAETIAAYLKAQGAAEAGAATIDGAADPSGRMLACLLADPMPAHREVLYELGYQLGRWIYLADAWEDAEQDAAKGQYNIFVKRFGQDKQAAQEAAAFNLRSAANRAILAYDLLPLKREQGILDNIMHEGIVYTTERILRGEKEQEKDHGSL